MTSWEFVAVLPDGTKIAPLRKAAGRKVTARLDEPSSVEFALAGDAPGASDIVELGTDVVAYRDGEPIVRGRIGPSTDDVDDASRASFTGLDYRSLVRSATIWPTSKLTFTNVDEAQIAWRLIRDRQALTGGDLGTYLGATGTTGTKRTRTFEAGKSIGEAIDDLATEGGWDWDITPDGAFEIYFPSRGATKDFVAFKGKGGTVTSVSRRMDPGEYANALRVSGADGVTPVVVEVDDLASRREGRWEAQIGFTDITDPDVLADRGTAELAKRSTLLPTYTVVLRAGAWRGPSTCWIGDTVRLVANEGRLDVDDYFRIYELEAVPGDDGGEQVTLTLGHATSKMPRRVARLQRRVTNLERRTGASTIDSSADLGTTSDAGPSDLVSPSQAAVASFVADMVVTAGGITETNGDVEIPAGGGSQTATIQPDAVTTDKTNPLAGIKNLLGHRYPQEALSRLTDATEGLLQIVHFGDSTVEGATHSGAHDDCYVDHVRTRLESVFGATNVHDGFQGVWRRGTLNRASDPARWLFASTGAAWATAASDAQHGPHPTYLLRGSIKQQVARWSRPGGAGLPDARPVHFTEFDIVYINMPSTSTDGATGTFSYSVNGGFAYFDIVPATVSVPTLTRVTITATPSGQAIADQSYIHLKAGNAAGTTDAGNFVPVGISVRQGSTGVEYHNLGCSGASWADHNSLEGSVYGSRPGDFGLWFDEYKPHLVIPSFTNDIATSPNTDPPDPVAIPAAFDALRDRVGCRTITDAALTAGSATITTTGAQFTAADVDRRVSGPGIAPGTVVASYVDVDEITVSNPDVTNPVSHTITDAHITVGNADIVHVGLMPQLRVASAPADGWVANQEALRAMVLDDAEAHGHGFIDFWERWGSADDAQALGYYDTGAAKIHANGLGARVIGDTIARYLLGVLAPVHGLGILAQPVTFVGPVKVTDHDPTSGWVEHVSDPTGSGRAYTDYYGAGNDTEPVVRVGNINGTGSGIWFGAGVAATPDSSILRTGSLELTVTGALKKVGLTGATTASRWVGSTTAGAPASGTFTAGDWVTSRDGNVYVCTVGGTPGTWTSGGAGSFTTLAASGATTLSSTLAVTGAATLSSTLAVTGASTLTGAVAMGASATVAGQLTVTGATIVKGDLYGNTIGGADLHIGSTTNASKGLVIVDDGFQVVNATTFSVSPTSGNVAFKGNLAMGTTSLNKFTVAGATGNTVIAGTLDVTGVTTLTAQPILSALTASQAVFTDASKGLVSVATTGTGSVVLAAGPTFTGTITAAAVSLSSTLVGGSATDITINTNKFTVTASTGAMLAAGNVTLGTALAGNAHSVFGSLTLSGTFTASIRIATSGNWAPVAGTTFTPATSYVKATGAGAVTMTATPTITVGTAGQELVITQTGAGSVVLQRESALAGSKLRLGAATRTLNQYDTITLWCDGTYWIETGFVDNT